MSTGSNEHLFDGAAGRATLVSRLQASLRALSRTEQVVVVADIGIDRMSAINDTWGFTTGDALLEQVERRLAVAFAEAHVVERVAADHFLVVCAVDQGEDVEADIAVRVMNAVTGQYDVQRHLVYVTVSVGVAGCADADASAPTLYSAAESARVAARRSGGRRWERSDQVMRVRVREQVRTEQALLHAIENNELSLRYQPIVDLASTTVTGFEALARWSSPELGNVPPSHFIARAEDTGLIVPLGHWAIEEVAKHWSELSSLRHFGMVPTVAINVSGVQMRLDSENLVRSLIEMERVLPGQLWVEITESALLEDPDGVREILTELRDAGIRVVIDDFGTGYSSLSKLRLLPVDAIKIDRVFIGRIHESPRDQAIVKAMVQLAHALGIFAIAEGVETEPQLAALRDMGCDQVQGFLFSAALGFDQVRQMLEGGHDNRAARGWNPLLRMVSDEDRYPSSGVS